MGRGRIADAGSTRSRTAVIGVVAALLGVVGYSNVYLVCLTRRVYARLRVPCIARVPRRLIRIASPRLLLFAAILLVTSCSGTESHSHDAARGQGCVFFFATRWRCHSLPRTVHAGLGELLQTSIHVLMRSVAHACSGTRIAGDLAPGSTWSNMAKQRDFLSSPGEPMDGSDTASGPKLA
ncbi:hypothetical protein EON66_01870 [archaeon]|nr:MAG: hypothetical protein EON66_01870 [archaeon]